MKIKANILITFNKDKFYEKLDSVSDFERHEICLKNMKDVTIEIGVDTEKQEYFDVRLLGDDIARVLLEIADIEVSSIYINKDI
jgi:hypothetical protein